MDEILELATANARIQDFFNFEFFLIFDDHRRRRILDATGDIVGTNGLKTRHMEHRMDSHRGGKFETESGFADLGDDLERAEALVVELVAGASCLDVVS
jgi:hypothetical protein